MTSGSTVKTGFQSSTRRVKIFSSLSLYSLTATWPGNEQEKWNEWYDLMFCSWRKWWLKWFTQLYMGTKVSPDWVPTNCAWLASADLSTSFTRSSKQSIVHRRRRCLSSPKHQSGENFVWPTSINDSVMLS